MMRSPFIQYRCTSTNVHNGGELLLCSAPRGRRASGVVPALDRLARSLQDLITLVGDLRRAGIGFRSLHEALDTTIPGGRLVFHVFAALAEFIRELIVEGTHEGLDAARAAGKRLGRPRPCPPSRSVTPATC
ncbi:recombinase family protein [Nocardiopsis kunsanensis]|uniref:recombinase family protein n=1 Tax=Nocardiopsis kunsanensis TaxID=141693 RepID=UPI001EF9CDFB|nr:recombinase family protein [Nocardiopsis kunsanensis]